MSASPLTSSACRLPRTRRITGDYWFGKLKREGKRRSGSTLGLVYCKSPESLKVGVRAVKRSGNSPERNRMKRLLKEFIRTHWGAFPKTGYLLITAFRPFQQWTSELEAQLLSLLQSLPVVHTESHLS